MTNRKLKKILRENAINPDEDPAPRAALGIPRKFILRSIQIAACFLLAAAVGFGWVSMVRLVGRPDGAEAGGSSPDPGFQFSVTTDADGHTSISVVDNGDGFNIDGLTFDAQPLTFFYADGMMFPEVNVEEIRGDIVSDSMYYREIKIKDSVSRGINHQNYANSEMLLEGVRTSVKSGDGDGIVIANGDTVAALAAGGLIQNMLGTKYLDFTNDYWPSRLVGDLGMNGKLYFASGNISTNTLVSAYMTVYNKDKVALLGLEDPYNLVKSGNWTLEKLLAMSTDMYADINGDAQLSDADRYGVTAKTDGISALAYAYGIRLVNNGTNAVTLSPVLTDGGAEAFCGLIASAVDQKKLGAVSQNYRLTEKSDFIFTITTLADMMETSHNVYNFDFDPEILPLPKADAGADYTSPVSSSAIFYAITSGADTDMASAVIEYFASSVNSGISMILRIKLASSTESSEMLGLINDKMSFDLGRVLSSQIYDPNRFLAQIAVGNERVIKSALVTGVKTYETAISKLAAALK